MTRNEHLAWAKKRALEHVDRGEVANGFTSMLSDLSKHDELRNHKGGELGVRLMMLPGWINNSAEVRRWIVGFN